MQSEEHKKHIAARISWNSCPECRADNSRWRAQTRPHEYKYVREYLSWVRPRLEAIRNGAIEQGRAKDSYEALWWYRDFINALHRRISSHLSDTGRKHAPDYARYHMRTYGNDYRFIHNS